MVLSLCSFCKGSGTARGVLSIDTRVTPPIIVYADPMIVPCMCCEGSGFQKEVVEMERDEMKVPLQVSWLSENGLLHRALAMHGYAEPYRFSEVGFRVRGLNNSGPHDMRWDSDSLLFTLAQLATLGFQEK